MSCSGRPPTSPPEVHRHSASQTPPLSDEQLRRRLLALGEGGGRRWIVPPAARRLKALSGSDPRGVIRVVDTAAIDVLSEHAPFVLALPETATDRALATAARQQGIGLLGHRYSPIAFQAFVDGALGSPREVVIPGQVVGVHGRGLLLTGPAGCGKSEACLGLLDRGHALVADDAVQAGYRPETGWTATACAEQMGRMAIRGLGMVDVAAIFGRDALVAETHLHLEVRLDPGLRLTPDDLLHGSRPTPTLPELPCLALPATPGRNLPLLLETAIRQPAPTTARESSPPHEVTQR